MSVRFSFALIGLLLPLSACVDAAKPHAVTGEASSIPDSAAGNQLSWVLDALARPPEAKEIAARFTPSLAAEVPPSAAAQLFVQLHDDLHAFVLDNVVVGTTQDSLVAVVRTEGIPIRRMRIEIIVEPGGARRIARLLISPVPDTKVASSWAEVDSDIREVAPLTNFLAAEIQGGECHAIASFQPSKPLAMGSTFKLYILEALTDQISRKQRAWTDALVISAARKSLPSGDLRNEPDGRAFTLRQVAEKMIANSDNTAADHLLDLVGRENVEAVERAASGGAAARNAPFLSTREAFALKLLASPQERADYVAASVDAKRKLLLRYQERDLSGITPAALNWTKPASIDSIEWFASPGELCNVMATLNSTSGAEVRSILSVNPGLSDDNGAYAYIGYKGGSEPGVLNATWLLERKRDHKWVFLTVGFNDMEKPIDEQRANAVLREARAYLAN